MPATPMNLDVADRAERALSDYLAAYRKRQRQRGGLVFGTREQDALVALFWTLYAEKSRTSQSIREGTGRVDELVTSVFRGGDGHDIGVDIAGYVSVQGFGVLAVSEAPVAPVELAYTSGAASGAVRGIYGVGWRALFLAAAGPYLDWRNRRSAVVELNRRVGYLAERLDPGERQVSALSLSDASRVLFLAAELARLTGNSQLASLTNEQVADLVGRQRLAEETPGGPGEEPLLTAHLAQFVMAAACSGHDEAAAQALQYLLSTRFDGLAPGLWRTTNGENREMSPWVALALLTAFESTDGRRATA